MLLNYSLISAILSFNIFIDFILIERSVSQTRLPHKCSGTLQVVKELGMIVIKSHSRYKNTFLHCLSSQ